jgi:hypothetical protein
MARTVPAPEEVIARRRASKRVADVTRLISQAPRAFRSVAPLTGGAFIVLPADHG